ncbi:MAG: lipid-binding SYLF domain-containing protein, partial [Pseudomonadota bacterium]|nr:lipid-binding SYLF domain-containing protein [Pseudomonadota bacterium]
MTNIWTIIFKLSAVFVLASCSAILGPELRKSDTLVVESLNTLVVIQNREDLSSFRATAKDAAAIAIFPKVLKAGFFLGAEGGNGIVMARDTTGAWGYPAFYTLVGGSWGLQAGGQQAAVVFVIRSRKALKALLAHQGKVGADIGIALGP